MNKALSSIKIVIMIVLCMPGVLLPLSRAMQVSKSYQTKQLTPEQRKALAQKAVMMKAKRKEYEKIILAGHEGELSCVTMTPNGKMIATAAEGGKNNLILWSGQTGEKLKTFTVDEGNIKEVRINNDGSKVLVTVTKHFSMPAFSSETDIIQAGKGEVILLYDIKNGALMKKIENLPNPYVFDMQFNSYGDRIILTLVKKDNIEIVDYDIDEKNHIVIIDADTGNNIATHEIMNNVPHIDINPDGNTGVIRSGQGLIMYNLNNGKVLKKLKGPTSKIYSVEYSMNGNKIIARDNATFKTFIWNGNSGSLITELGDIGWDAFFYAGASQVVSQTSNSILLWDIASKTKLLEIPTDTPVNYVQVSSKASLIAASYNDGTIDIWDAKTGIRIHTLKHDAKDKYVDIEFSADGKRLQSHSGSEDKCTVIMWNIETGKQMHKFLENHELLAMDTNFITIVSPDDKNLRNLILWKLSRSLSNTEEKALKEKANVPPKTWWQRFMGH